MLVIGSRGEIIRFMSSSLPIDAFGGGFGASMCDFDAFASDLVLLLLNIISCSSLQEIL